MKNVFFIHHTSDFNGGSDKSLYELVANLDRRNITPIICLRHGDPYIKKYKTLGIRIISLSLISPPKKLISLQGVKFLFNFFPSVFSLAYLILRYKIDVVHVNTSINIQGGFAGFLSRRPVIWHVRELLGQSLLDRAVKLAVTLFATKIITISKSVYASIESKNKILVYNGMDLSDYNFCSRKDSVVVNCVGRFEEWKGQHIALKAIANLHKEFPNTTFQFIGSPAINKPSYYQSLVDFVELNSIKNVKFLGNRNDVPIILQSSHILLVPTCTSEPFGRTVIEGMAAGNIVIATNEGGPREIISHQVNGFLVTVNSVNEMTDMLRYVLLNIDKLETIQDNAKKCVKEKFDIKRVSNEMESIFNGVLN